MNCLRNAIARLPVTVVAVVVTGGAAWGQVWSPYERSANNDGNQAEVTEADAGAVPEVSEVQPKVYYFEDGDGELVPVPDITLEDLTRLRDLERGLTQPERPPRFSITELSLEGSATGTHAEIAVRVRIKIRTDGPVRVPLLLPEFVLQQPAQFEGPGDVYSLDYSEKDGGYVAWIRAAPDTQHTVTLKGGVPLARSGRETWLRLNVPRAVSPVMRMLVPQPNATATIVDGTGLLTTSPRDGQTELTVQGLRGRFELTWQPAAAPVKRIPTVMRVHGQILVKILGPDEFRSVASLEVHSYGRPIDSFQVRLPAGQELVEKEFSNYTVTTLDPEPGKQDAGKIVEVKLDGKKEWVGVDLETSLTRPPRDTDTPTDVAGFQVLGALRQSGVIALSAEGDWSLYWEEGPQVRRVAELSEPPWPDQTAASFEYFRQPCSLRVWVRPMKTRIAVEPTYFLDVRAHQFRLTARLKYTLHGAPASFLRVDMAGWEVQSIGSQGHVNQDSLDLEKVTPLTIPLWDVASGIVEIDVHATKSIDPQGGQVEVDLPHPHATSLTPAEVVVVSDENVQLTPRAEKMPQLIPTSPSEDLEAAVDVAGAICYRDRGDQAQSRFVCDLTIHPPSMSVEVEGRIRVTDVGIQVRQTFDYRVRNEALMVVPLSLHPDLMEQTDFTLLFDGDALEPNGWRVEPADAGEERYPVAWVRLPSPRIGSFRLEAVYELPAPPLTEFAETGVTIPLLMPAHKATGVSTILETNSLLVEATGMTVSVDDDSPWEVRGDDLAGPSNSGISLTAATRADHVHLLLSKDRVAEPNSTLVEAAFAQTRLDSNARQDRASFRVLTSEQTIRLSLPSGAERSVSQVLLDQVRVATTESSRGELVVALPGDQPGHHVIDVLYSFPSRPPVGAFSIELPRIEGAKWTREFFWQLITPAREHLVVGPRGMTREDQWQWTGGAWHRSPRYDELHLEQWVGASPRTHQPPAELNQYLFSAFGSVERIEVRTGERHFILAVCSGSVLVIGLVLIYVPMLRNPASLLVGVLIVVFVSFLYPTPALIVIQAGGLGFALVVLACVLLWTIGRQHPSRPVVRGKAYAGPDTRSTELVSRPREDNAGGSSSIRRASSVISTPDAKP